MSLSVKHVQDIKHLSDFLCVSCGKVTLDGEDKSPVINGENGRRVQGLITIAKYLCQHSHHKALLGRSAEEASLVHQWLEYSTTTVERSIQDKDINNVLKELNGYLADRAYLTGFQLSLADIVLYLGMHNMFSGLSFYEKQQYMHVSRWFDQVQHTPGVQQHLSKVHFQKNLIYGLGSH